ncbi:hypothetical protein BDDG_06884 [Blastomyces dermatitidis ATCC 18188]|uniref:Uncharacterized protein n=1 Tax=Ajellomyces dermatitidis (strain ATCC 18188 / CBS 674.68) TaxID=653446 RepID=F2TL26_AJEDA|nr:hypothetical protein BDDG_06884 [Blastomyces dermatitidis ATCC 18188]
MFPISQSLLFASCHTGSRLPGGRGQELCCSSPGVLPPIISGVRAQGCSVSNTARLGQRGDFSGLRQPLLEKGKSVILVQGLTQINYGAKGLKRANPAASAGPGPGLSHGSDPPVNPNSKPPVRHQPPGHESHQRRTSRAWCSACRAGRTPDQCQDMALT